MTAILIVGGAAVIVRAFQWADKVSGWSQAMPAWMWVYAVVLAYLEAAVGIAILWVALQ